MKAINIYTQRKINTDNYINTITGEVLFSEYPNLTSINVKDANLIIVDYGEFITIDSKALRYILTIFNQADMSKILRMADMVKGIYNVLHDEKGSAHSPQSLRLSLSYDAAEFSRFLKRLHTKSIIHYIAGYKDGRKCKYISMILNFSKTFTLKSTFIIFFKTHQLFFFEIGFKYTGALTHWLT